MTGQQILESLADKDFALVAARAARMAGIERDVEAIRAETIARIGGTVDEAAMVQWATDSAEAPDEQRRQAARQMRINLMKASPVLGGTQLRIRGLSLATIAALIDMLEA